MGGFHPAENGDCRGDLPRSRAPTSSGNGSIIQSARDYTTSKRLLSSPPLFRTLTWVLIVLCASFLSFYLGVWTGIHAASGLGGERKLNNVTKNLSDGELQRKVEALAKQKVKAQLEDLCKKMPSVTPKDAGQKGQSSQNNFRGGSNLFPKSLSHFALGLVRVAKDDLMQTFDFGVPPNPNTEDMDALILYNKKEALPSDENVARAARYEDPSKQLPHLSAKTATENCDTMNVVLIDNPGNTRQCFALVGGQYQSYHVQRWMRRPENYGQLDPKMSLKLTSRAWTAGGKQEFYPPTPRQAKRHQERLLTYLNEADGIKSRLKQVLQKMNQKTVVIMTCNHGQSELLMNFACSARARGFDLQNVLVFPTDMETKKLADGLGLATFYEEKIMASVPKAEAAIYGDGIFTSVMFAKVLCVQLVNELGHDLLFQDADVVWYKDPLDYFHDKSLPEFDIYFQDDGSRQERYAPYSANTGFYYVRSNDKTRHLFRNMLYSADLIAAWNSHQQVLIALLAEHSSLMGLSVKIFPKEMEEFPGGLQFHRKKEPLKKIMNGDSKAFIFHMSWTGNKTNKLKFFQQMGEWYLNEKCIGKEAHELIDEKSELTDLISDGVLSKHCCSAEPLVTCHYRDKPSKIPCLDSPRIDNNGKSFW
mmetsp:Transcript_40233/g.85673  ORF Transcript_40233/g.85673 Transcript_40233/m.85673 type:complete len:648 (-) Transcript_40233:46-1989(-)